MVESSFPFHVPPGNTMSEVQWCEMFRYVVGTGVLTAGFPDGLNELAVTSLGSRKFKIDSGAAWIQGHFYMNDGLPDLTVTIDANSDPGLPRMDMILLDCKWGLNAGIHVTWAKGAVNASPTPPSPIQTYGVRWQIPLATITLPANNGSTYVVTDQRTFVGSGAAKTSTFVIASDKASPTMRANADATVPTDSNLADVVINAGIAYVSTMFGGGTVQLSEGTFRTSDSIDMESNVNLRGMGESTIIALQPAGLGKDVINSSNNSNFTISDLAINGGGLTEDKFAPGATAPSGAGSDGIAILEGNHISVRNVRIAYMGGSGINMNSKDSTSTASYGWDIEGCSITCCSNWGISMSGNHGRIHNNEIYFCSNGMLLIGYGGWGASGNIVQGNMIRNILRQGILLDAEYSGGTGNVSQNNLIGNSILNIATDGPQIENYALRILHGNENMINGNFFSQWISGKKPTFSICVDAASLDNTVIGNHGMADAASNAATFFVAKAAKDRTKGYSPNLNGMAANSW